MINKEELDELKRFISNLQDDTDTVVVAVAKEIAPQEIKFAHFKLGNTPLAISMIEVTLRDLLHEFASETWEGPVA